MRGIALVLGLCLLYLVVDFCTSFPEFHSRPKTDISREQAVSTIERMQTGETRTINPLCKTRLLEQPKPTGKVLVIFHGFTNCPQQFEQIGQQFYELGYTVIIPRMPYHGEANRNGWALVAAQPEEYIAFADSMVNTAHGFGDKVDVLGLSAGGLLAAWVAQERNDVNRVMVIAPNFHHPDMTTTWAKPTTYLAGHLPLFIWWDDQAKAELAGPDYAYPGFPLTAMGAFFTISHAILDEPPDERNDNTIIIVNNDEDKAINREMMQQYIDLTKSQAKKTVLYDFPQGVVKAHDIIDPNQVDENVEAVYPKLIDLMTGSQGE